MKTSIHECSWMGQLITAYEKILSPDYNGPTLAKANVVICEALAKLEKLTKKKGLP